MNVRRNETVEAGQSERTVSVSQTDKTAAVPTTARRRPSSPQAHRKKGLPLANGKSRGEQIPLLITGCPETTCLFWTTSAQSLQVRFRSWSTSLQPNTLHFLYLEHWMLGRPHTEANTRRGTSESAAIPDSSLARSIDRCGSGRRETLQRQTHHSKSVI